MSENVLDLADKLWRGAVSTADVHPVGHLGGLAEIADGVAFVPTFANVSAFATDDGLVLVDTGSSVVAPLIHQELRRWSSQRLNTAIFSHGHIDHVFGVAVWEEESRAENWADPVVYAHEHMPRRFDRYILTNGYNQIINRRQFGLDELLWPMEYRYPDETYRDSHELSIGNLDLSLRHEKGETDDHTITWIPSKKILCCGDLFIWASPNAGNPQKVQRYPKEWAEALRRMSTLGAEALLPGHGLPVIGPERVTQALDETATYLESIVEQTLAFMNNGARLDEALHGVRPPASLAERPYLKAVYDEPEFIVHNIWRLYGGWWDGNPATLKSAPERDLAQEIATLAGGPASLADRALALTDQAQQGESPSSDAAYRLAGHLIEMAWLAAPEDPAIQEARRLIFSARADAATSTMAQGVFRWAARESESPHLPHGQEPHS